LEHISFFGQVLWIEWAHFWKDRVQLCAIFARIFALDRRRNVALGGIRVQFFIDYQFFRFPALLGLCEGKKSLNHPGLVPQFVKVCLIDEVDDEAFFRAVADTGANDTTNFANELWLAVRFFVVLDY